MTTSVQTECKLPSRIVKLVLEGDLVGLFQVDAANDLIRALIGTRFIRIPRDAYQYTEGPRKGDVLRNIFALEILVEELALAIRAGHVLVEN